MQFENWDFLKTHVKHKWGKLTDADLVEINGSKPRLVEKLMLRYGWKVEHAQEEIRKFERSLAGENLKHKKNTSPGKRAP